MQWKLRYPLGKGFHCGTNDLTSLFLRLLRWLSHKPFVPLPLGAGKTTTFSMLTGDLSISQGTAYMDGYNILTNLRQVCKKIGTGSESNFQLSVNSNLGLLWLYFTLLCDWSRKLVPSSQPIRCKTKNSGDVVIRVFPRFKHYACFT